MKIYRCPNNCYVSDSQKRCPSCDKMLLYDGEGNKEEAEKKTHELHLAHSGEEPKYRKRPIFSKKLL